MKILGTGLTGLVGSRIVELLGQTHEFINLSRSTGVNIVEKDSVSRAIASSDAPIVLHMAAKTDVDGCEKDKAVGKEGEAWKINVEGTQNVAEACSNNLKKLIYISTDFVFDGEKESYSEEDTPNPINWYGQTKYEGEKVVQSIVKDFLVARVSYPYRASFEKRDFARSVQKLLSEGKNVAMVTDHIFTPTFIDDIAGALEVALTKNLSGTVHITGSQHLSPYESGKIIAKIFGYNEALVQQTTRADFFKNRAQRPFRLAMKNDRIVQLGVEMKTFQQGVEALKNQSHLR